MKRLWLLSGVFAALAAFPRLAQAHPAWGIVVDREGRVFFCDLFHEGGTVWRVDRDGKLSRIVTGRHSHDLYLDKQGRLFGTHLESFSAGNEWASRLWRTDRDGGGMTSIIPETRDPKRFWGDQFLPDADGNIYFAYGPELRVRKGGSSSSLLAGGARGRRDGQGREAQFGTLGGMAWGPDGAIFVADDDAIRRVTLDGRVSTWARGLLASRPANPEQHGRPFGLTFDAADSAYVADPEGRRVVKVERAGWQARAVITSEGDWSPYGVASSGGDLYVLEVGFVPPRTYLGPRVRRLAADGKITTIAIVK